MYLPTNNN